VRGIVENMPLTAKLKGSPPSSTSLSGKTPNAGQKG
jgi:hypothetical protein